jgi:pimeloyl-ACP methyl ester carboxylesterase
MTKKTQLLASETTISYADSLDGARIGYYSFGQGPGLVPLPGSMESAQSHRQLGEALAGLFTIYLPDRRGRGLSGPYGFDYGIRREVEDLTAVLAKTGAHYVFGVSSSGLIALEAAGTLPAVHKIAVYEPALLPAGSRQTDWRAPRQPRQAKRRHTRILLRLALAAWVGQLIVPDSAGTDRCQREKEQRTWGPTWNPSR